MGAHLKSRRTIYLISGLLLLLLVSAGVLWFLFGSSPLTATGQAPTSQGVQLAIVTRWPTPFATPHYPPTEVAAMQEIYKGINTGTVIAQSANTTPVGTPGLLVSYEVKEYTLPVPVTMDVRLPKSSGNRLDPSIVTFQKVWLLVVRGGPFLAANNVWSIWLDNTIVGASGGGRDGISAFIYDPQLLREGAAIGVSWGLGPPVEDYYLPELLHFDRPPTP